MELTSFKLNYFYHVQPCEPSSIPGPFRLRQLSKSWSKLKKFIKQFKKRESEKKKLKLQPENQDSKD